MIVIADALALTLIGTTEADYPVIGWDNLVTSSNVAATAEDADYPARNLANPATNQLWKGTGTGTQYLTVTMGAGVPVSFVGIARHNFGTIGATITIQYDPGTGSWATLAGPQIPGDDRPLLFISDETVATGVRVKIENATAIPQAAVLSVGLALRMQRGVQPGVMPFPHGRSREYVNGAAQNGDYLGDIQIRERLNGSMPFKALDADWYRQNVQDFVDVARTPFFVAWMPASYPTECAYAWCTEDPQPGFAYGVPDYLDLTLKMEGLAL